MLKVQDTTSAKLLKFLSFKQQQKSTQFVFNKFKVKSYDNGKVAPQGLSLCMWKVERQTMYFDNFTNSLEHIFGSLLYNNMMNSTMQCLFLTFQMKCPYALKISAIEL